MANSIFIESFLKTRFNFEINLMSLIKFLSFILNLLFGIKLNF